MNPFTKELASFVGIELVDEAAGPYRPFYKGDYKLPLWWEFYSYPTFPAHSRETDYREFPESAIIHELLHALIAKKDSPSRLKCIEWGLTRGSHSTTFGIDINSSRTPSFALVSDEMLYLEEQITWVVGASLLDGLKIHPGMTTAHYSYNHQFETNLQWFHHKIPFINHRSPDIVYPAAFSLIQELKALGFPMLYQKKDDFFEPYS